MADTSEHVETALPQDRLGTLGHPFSQMFGSLEEAEWAFDCVRTQMAQLGVSSAEHKLSAITLYKDDGWWQLRANTWNKPAIDVLGTDSRLQAVRVVLPPGQYHSGQLSKPEKVLIGDQEFRVVQLPIDAFRFPSVELQKAMEAVLAARLDAISGYPSSPWHSNQEQRYADVARAVYDPERRIKLFRNGFDPRKQQATFGSRVQINYWKISPGESGGIWQQCKEGGYIAMGWNELGDVSALSRAEFDNRAIDVIGKHPDWKQERLEQVWQLAKSVKTGDQIVANRGTSEVLGIGTVTGPYWYVAGEEYAHRVPVEWTDTTIRSVDEGGWRKTLIKLDPAKFRSLEGALPVERVLPDETVGRVAPSFTLENCAGETLIEANILERWLSAIARKKQAVLYGPPGTGKTFVAQRLAKVLANGDESRIAVVQFHPSYSYEEFMQGIRPETRDGKISYPMRDGRFVQFCRKMSTSSAPAVMIIDEMNRANLSRVFGEMMYLLEYRGADMQLASGDRFSIPANVYVIGTMNTADRSIALVDHALRRRFAFISLAPDYDMLRRYHTSAESGMAPARLDRLVALLQEINGAIGDANLSIGVSFFMHDNANEDIEHIWRLEIEPYLEELFHDQPDRMKLYRWDIVRSRLAE